MAACFFKHRGADFCKERVDRRAMEPRLEEAAMSRGVLEKDWV